MNSNIVNHAAAIYTKLLQDSEFWSTWIVNQKPELANQDLAKKLAFASHLLAAGFADFTAGLAAHVRAQSVVQEEQPSE